MTMHNKLVTMLCLNCGLSLTPQLTTAVEQTRFNATATEPYIIRGRVGATNLQDWSTVFKGTNTSMPMLQALGTDHTQFMWQSQNACADFEDYKHYMLLSRWTRGTWEEWRTRRDWYLQARVDVSPAAFRLALRGIPSFVVDSFTPHGYGLLISHAGSSTSTHWDANNKVLMQAHGDKQGVLLAQLGPLPPTSHPNPQVTNRCSCFPPTLFPLTPWDTVSRGAVCGTSTASPQSTRTRPLQT